ncbi:condensation domain-containing protein [Pseudomonas aeruginosa]|nr:condensation domain-containing protein [Pseudomonas aeruginosa]
MDALQRSFDSLVARHETLRTRFRLEGGRSYQQVQPAVSVSIEREQFGEEGLIERIQAIVVQPFDLERGPLLRVNLLQLAEDDHVLVLVQHHIVSDGWSMQVMVEELVQLYAGYSQGLDVVLPALPISTRTTPCGSAAGWRRGKRSASWRTGPACWAASSRCWVAVRSAAAGPAEPSWRAVGFRAIAGTGRGRESLGPA